MTRNTSKTLTIVLCSGLVWPSIALAEIDLAKEMNICMSFEGEPTNSEIVLSCTRLINAAQAENETIGFFYAMRSFANSDRAMNCSDGKKAKELITDPNLTDTINQVISSNC